MYLKPIEILAHKKWRYVNPTRFQPNEKRGHSRSIETRTRHSFKAPETFMMTHWWYLNQNNRARYNAFHIERVTLHDMMFWWCILGCWFLTGLPKCAVRVPNRNAWHEILGSEVSLVYPWVLVCYALKKCAVRHGKVFRQNSTQEYARWKVL